MIQTDLFGADRKIPPSTREKQERRALREQAFGVAVNMARRRGENVWGVIYTDPPWQWEARSTKGEGRSAKRHYPTMPTDQIAALPVGELAYAKMAVLFMWAINSMLDDALLVMKAWGFVYKVNFAWIKDRECTGYIARGKHELLLYGTRGNPPGPAPGTQFDSAIGAPRGQHSAKPAIFASVIESYFPN